ncbi:MAG: tetratricopeptide repeat protein [Gammaproteobacteria bacterium]|nr:tetratricopeptide repeat protein [Gammaproteobacteria bacterium]MDH3750165.1 tetratricopeptide repeat protein [Gammaproteobacteria bacterium]
MPNLIRELRRREVFRATGLYVGVAWILIEVASVLLPAFDAPDWVMRTLIIIAIIGLPVAIVLAWIYDVTDKGIEAQGDPTDTVIVPFGARKMDFAVIGMLSVALIFSVYLNITGIRSTVTEEIEPVSVLIADFENKTGDELFDGTLEQALQIGIESAPFITGYRRDAALRVALSMQETNNILDEATARLVSVREGIKLVMAGGIEEKNGSYTLYVRAVDPKGGEVLASVDVGAKSKLDVLAAVGTLAGDLREELGDDSLDRKKLVTSETFTASNLEAAQAYAKAQSLQYNGKYEEAMSFYQGALDHDPNFGRAYSGLALSASSLGRIDEANELWDKALENLDTMTERERLRTLGLYYSRVTRNRQKSIESYRALVEKYPADDAAHNGLAIQYFYSLDFENALKAGGALLEIYPSSVMGRSNYALYAMYASDFETAVTEAKKVRDLDPTYFKAWLPVAAKALADGDIGAAKQAYDSMSQAGGRGELTSALGRADAALYSGSFEAAGEMLRQGIGQAEAAGSQYYLSTNYVALADTYVLEGDSTAAIKAVEAALAISGGLSRQVPAALIYLQAGDPVTAKAIADELANSLQPQSRAYARLIDGLIALDTGEHVEAINLISAGARDADLWLLRYYLGKAYFEAGYFAEALDEFLACIDRQGEAMSIFLDDLPTYRYMATVPYWLGRAQQELGMQEAATENYTAFIKLRPEGGPLADDARQRLP